MGNKNNGGRSAFKQAMRERREGAFILYFESLFRNDDIKELFDVTAECEEADQALRISDESCELACRVAEKAPEIDKIIEGYSPRRNISRIAKINLAVLRLALYEAEYADNVPVNVAISEAVAISEKYAQAADVAFINGVLGAYSRAKKNADTKNSKEKSDNTDNKDNAADE